MAPKFGIHHEVERMDDLNKVPAHWVAEHKARYDFAKPFCQMKKVLDAGCGIGYGSEILAETAEAVYGVDIDSGAIEKANTEYSQKNTFFQRMNLTGLAFRGDVFDVVVSFEVIEHLENYKAYLSEISRILTKEGIFIVSTPNEKYSGAAFNLFHFREFSFEEFSDLLQSYFSEVEMFGQSINLKAASIYQSSLGMKINKLKANLGIQFLVPSNVKRIAEKLLTGRSMTDVEKEDFLISKKNAKDCMIYIAVCRYKKSTG